MRLNLSRSFPDLWGLRLQDFVAGSIIALIPAVFLSLPLKWAIDTGAEEVVAGWLPPLVLIAFLLLLAWTAFRQQKSILARYRYGSLLATTLTIILTAPLAFMGMMVILFWPFIMEWDVPDDSMSQHLTALVYFQPVAVLLIFNRWVKSRVGWIMGASLFATVLIGGASIDSNENIVRVASAASIALALTLVTMGLLLNRHRFSPLLNGVLIFILTGLPILFAVALTTLVKSPFSYLSPFPDKGIDENQAMIINGLFLIFWPLLLTGAVQVVYKTSIQPAAK